MILIRCDYHPSWQQVCWLETTTGEMRVGVRHPRTHKQKRTGAYVRLDLRGLNVGLGLRRLRGLRGRILLVNL